MSDEPLSGVTSWALRQRRSLSLLVGLRQAAFVTNSLLTKSSLSTARLVWELGLRAKHTSNGDLYFNTSLGSSFKILWYSGSAFAQFRLFFPIFKKLHSTLELRARWLLAIIPCDWGWYGRLCTIFTLIYDSPFRASLNSEPWSLWSARRGPFSMYIAFNSAATALLFSIERGLSQMNLLKTGRR